MPEPEGEPFGAPIDPSVSAQILDANLSPDGRRVTAQYLYRSGHTPTPKETADAVAAEHFGIAAFWFGSLAGATNTDGQWHAIDISGGGMTGDQSVATQTVDGLNLAVECLIQAKVWIETETPGTGAEQVAIQLDETAIGGTADVRGLVAITTGETMALAAYDGWLSAGTTIKAAYKSSTANTIKPSSYLTVILTPVK